MLSTIFGFNGKIGRLRYFLLSIGVGLTLILVVFALLVVGGVLFVNSRHSFTVYGRPYPAVVVIVLAFGLLLLIWIGLALQTKRFRDMGWNPLYAILGWMALGIVDRSVVMLMPSLAFWHQQQSIPGLLINVILAGCLLFWPGADTEAGQAVDEGRNLSAPSGQMQSGSRSANRPSAYIHKAPRPGFGRRGN